VDTRGYVHRDKAGGFREHGSIDVESLAARVAALPESYWRERNASKPNRFDTLGNTAHIVMKFVHRPAEPTRYFDLPEWALWREQIQPLLDEAAVRCGIVRAEFPRVMLARLPAGGEITPHRDGGWYPAFCRKLHLPLITNPDTRFYVEPEWRHLPVGRLVEVNNNAPHGVRNAGSSARVHLIFELFESPLDVARHSFLGKRQALGGHTDEGAAAL
jgi:hypothetical protein